MTNEEKREITLALATRVMGWTDENPESSVPCWWDAANRRSRIKTEWNPLESLADAWMVVEAMGESLWECAIHVGHGGMKVYAGFVRGDVESGGYYDTAPEAICRAALEATEPTK
jgi:hypothetical protein